MVNPFILLSIAGPISKFVGFRIDSRIRSIVKSISQRILAFIITILATFFFVGNWEIYILVANFTKIFFYCIHERIWERVSWGKV